jgi:hypothetical protein
MGSKLKEAVRTLTYGLGKTGSANVVCIYVCASASLGNGQVENLAPEEPRTHEAENAIHR